jgi:lipid A disaccharide synthetase
VEAVCSLLMVAGETSGDQHGAALARALRVDSPQLRIYGLGGQQMRTAGVETLYDIEALNAVPPGWPYSLTHLALTCRSPDSSKMPVCALCTM